MEILNIKTWTTIIFFLFLFVSIIGEKITRRGREGYQQRVCVAVLQKDHLSKNLNKINLALSLFEIYIKTISATRNTIKMQSINQPLSTGPTQPCCQVRVPNGVMRLHCRETFYF